MTVIIHDLLNIFNLIKLAQCKIPIHYGGQDYISNKYRAHTVRRHPRCLEANSVNLERDRVSRGKSEALQSRQQRTPPRDGNV